VFVLIMFFDNRDHRQSTTVITNSWS